MTGKYILDDNHQVVPCNDLLEWAKWFETHEHRRVARTEIGDVVVSTVFLSLDHQFGEGPPILFETMVFGGPLNDEMDRASTWEEAEVMHAEFVERVTYAQNEETLP